MHRSALSILAAATTAASLAQYSPPDPSGFEGIIVEPYYVSDSADAADTDGSSELDPGEVTYRVFVDLKEGYQLLTVGGFLNHDLMFNTTTSFFNNDDRGDAWAQNINDAHMDVNTTAIDSWLSLGGANDAHWGVLKSEDPNGSIVGGVNNDGGSNAVPGGLLVNDTPLMGIPLTVADGLADLGITPPTSSYIGPAPPLFDPGAPSTYAAQDFAWAVLGGITTPLPSNKILIGQFTTDGVFTFCLNLWVKIPDTLVCADPNCHEYLEFYSEIVPSDTLGGGYVADNKFTHPSLCFDSSTLMVDCEGVPGGPAQPGTPCDDGNSYTSNDMYAANCDCLGEDCDGVMGGTALPGSPCDDGDPNTVSDTLDVNCDCAGIPTGIGEEVGGWSLSVHPNPVRDLLWIEINDATGQDGQWTLRDATGRALVTRDLGVLATDMREKVDMTDLASGSYTLEVLVGARREVRRIAKY